MQQFIQKYHVLVQQKRILIKLRELAYESSNTP